MQVAPPSSRRVKMWLLDFARQTGQAGRGGTKHAPVLNRRRCARVPRLTGAKLTNHFCACDLGVGPRFVSATASHVTQKVRSWQGNSPLQPTHQKGRICRCCAKGAIACATTYLNLYYGIVAGSARKKNPHLRFYLQESVVCFKNVTP